MTEEELRVLAGGGEMGARMRALDWSQNPLGPVSAWSASLRTAVGVVLTSPYPIGLFWGPELITLYNDSFGPLIGDKHPAGLGLPMPQVFSEVWDVAGPMFARVRAGETVSIENQPFFMNRQGFTDEGYFSFAYTPARDEQGRVAGIFDFVSESTRQVLAERRVKTLRELSIRTALAQDSTSVLHGAAEVLAHAGHDVPFALLYRQEGDTARLALRSGLEDSPVAPDVRPLADPASPWPLAEVLRAGEERLVTHLETRQPPLHAGPWPEPVRCALLLPMSLVGSGAHDAVLVVGISPRLALDESYRDFLRLLSRQIAADVTRARALEQEKQRAEQLAELDRSKTAFFSNVSHEFRTPLTLLLGPLEELLARGEALPPELRAELERMHRNGLRLFKLVNTLLRFSRLEAGRTQARFQPTDLARLTSGLASAFDSAARQGGVRLEVDCPPLPEPVWVDLDSWENIVLNLLSNAFKFTFAGSIRVRLHAQPGHVELSVSDTGTGIPAEELPRLFERFHQVKGARGRGHEGSGIGLALVRELVKLHGGEVHAASTPGEGTTFTVSIPRGHAHLPEALLDAASPSAAPSRASVAHLHEVSGWLGGSSPKPEAPEPPRPHATEGHILLADDNADMRDFVRGLLGDRYTIEAVSDGHAALAAARARPPDLVLSDVMMPGLDGFALVRALRSEPATASIPVLLLSARAGEEATVKGLRSGADDYLVKPFSARELLARVEGCLRLARERTEREREAVERADFERYLIGIVSHDLRTPLSAISLSATLLRRQPNLDEKVRRPLERIVSSTDRAQRMIRDLLDFTKARLSGRLPMEYKALDFHALVRQEMEELRAATPGRELALEQHGDGQVHWDGDRVAQVLTNLVSNALHYSPPGTPVRVRTRGEDGACVLEVHNEGPPIAADVLPRIFQPLERGVEGGSALRSVGLGLYIVEQIVRAHGGTIEVHSAPDVGTTFRVRLPREGDAHPAA